MNRFALIFLKNIFRAPFLLGKLSRYAKHPEKYTEEEMWAHIHKTMVYALKGSNVDLKVTGQEYLQQEGGYLLAGNHQGMFDVIAIASTCEKPLAIVYKKELKNTPVLRSIFACTNSFAMDREDVRQSLTVIQNVTAEMKKGRRYVIFPEGTRSKKGNVMGEFHGGSFRCAVKSKCPIIPMAFIDCFKPIEQKSWKPTSAQIHYLKPIPYEEYQGMTTVELAELVKSRIAAAMEENM